MLQHPKFYYVHVLAIMPGRLPHASLKHKAEPLIQSNSTFVPAKSTDFNSVQVRMPKAELNDPFKRFRPVAFALETLCNSNADVRVPMVYETIRCPEGY